MKTTLDKMDLTEAEVLYLSNHLHLLGTSDLALSLQNKFRNAILDAMDTKDARRKALAKLDAIDQLILGIR